MRQPSRLPITAGRVLAVGRGARMGGSLGAGEVSFAEVDTFRHINEPAQFSFTLPVSA